MGDREQDFFKIENPYIDMQRLRTWLNTCDECHRGYCHHLPKWKSIDPLKELLLVDTIHDCLVQCPGTTKYFALSYVWATSKIVSERQCIM